MRAGIRPYVTAGVALVGAGAIAVTPVNAAATQTPVSHQAVQLAALVVSEAERRVEGVGESLARTFGFGGRVGPGTLCEQHL